MFIINGILQVCIFSIIPIICWMITAKKEIGFFKWIGLKKVKIENKKATIMVFIGGIFCLVIPSIFIIPNFVDQSQMATNEFLGKGISMLLPAFIYSFITTGLSEEIFFRGFIAKRLISKFGLSNGNLIQAILFGLLHGLMFISIAGIIGSLIIIFITGMAGYLMGYINEKLSNGSIVSSWILHGCANLCASLIAMFTLI